MLQVRDKEVTFGVEEKSINFEANNDVCFMYGVDEGIKKWMKWVNKEKKNMNLRSYRI